MLTDKTVSQLLDAFAASDPTPGGGSAAALAGAIGSSLLLMVARMGKTRGGDDDRPTLDAAAAQLAPLASELRALVDRDTEAYDEVVAAYRLPKATDAEKGARREAIQRALRSAIEAPLAVMRACRAALAQVAVVERHGNPNAASDVTVARELLRAALNGARANVEINLAGVSDEAYVARVRREAAAD